MRYQELRESSYEHGKTMERHYYFVSHRNQDNTYVEAFKDMFIQVLDEF